MEKHNAARTAAGWAVTTSGLSLIALGAATVVVGSHWAVWVLWAVWVVLAAVAVWSVWMVRQVG